MSNNERSRGWCFTINNPNEWGTVDLENLINQAQYVVKGSETGETGTAHWQGFVYFKERKSFNQIRQWLPRAHIEKQRGTCSQAIVYCKKDNNFTEWGTEPVGPAGQKNKWKEIIKFARSGNIQEIEDNYPSEFLRYHSKLLALHKPERPLILDTLTNEWWFGKTGTGKSRELWSLYPSHFQKSLNKWWDGYDNQEIVAIEEWSPKNECTSSQLKIWADRYPFCAEIKGGTLQKIRPLKIIVLSNYSIDECFENSQDLEPIKRRFKVKQFLTL